MQRKDAEARLAFLEAAEALKDVMRSGFTAGGRPEDTAAHTWRLCLWVLVFEDQLQDVDAARLLKLCVLHDLGEAISGDIPAPAQTGDKSGSERMDFLSLLDPLPPAIKARFTELWDEYDRAETPEAHLAKGFDKLETILQHTQGANPDDFDYAFNLGYGREATERHPLLRLLRGIVDEKTADKIGIST